MEWKIGEIKQVNNEWYQCVEGDWCYRCDFYEPNFSASQCDKSSYCLAYKRKDKTSVIFKKLKKVGETYKKRVSDGTFSTFQRYKAYNSVILPQKPYMYCNFIDNTIEIEIKQNKEEDMKTVRISKDDLNFLVNKIRYGILPKHTDCDEIVAEITDLFSVEDVNLSNSENIGKNLKPFDLEAAKAGKPVCTRDGRKARIICFDAKCTLPIIALVTNTGGNESLIRYYSNGSFTNLNEAGCDLMMLSEKKEGWVNVCRNLNTNKTELDTEEIYNTKEEALQNLSSMTYITIIKISWEE